LFGDVAVFLNEQGRNTILDLAPRADELDPDIVNEVLISHSLSNIRVLASPPRPEFADQITSDQFIKVLQYFQRLYEYIIIDTTPYLTEIVQSALDIANLIVLIATQDIPSIKSINSFLSLSDQSGINRKRIFFVLNRFDKRIAISPERITESLKQIVEGVIPLEERIVTTSINRGVPFVIENKNSLISKSIYALADKVKEKISTQIEELET
jgi:pilus assembly protein CpaE